MLDLEAIFGDDSEPIVDVACKASAIDLTDATQVWQAALDQLEGDPLFPPEVMEALWAAYARWADDSEAGESNEAIEVIDPPYPCPKCRTLELWQSVAADLFGKTPGRWRCVRCDPPTEAEDLRRDAQRIRDKYPVQEWSHKWRRLVGEHYVRRPIKVPTMEIRAGKRPWF